ncbi:MULTISPECIES: urea transporter [Bacillus]|uniref:urea transporter n=1 Tax=Bacillus TaxID=1386 RepID=UPI0005B561E5|nr:MULTISPECIES: urea transporter [Bacillus]AJO18245.1 Urea transporter [Bacillus paralicheniformis]MBU5326502.1 urea transporter [Bacillus paralicheniformis]MBU8744691.1 urea transporter [Bacillus paralicheniformis]MBU8758624.1 urea transporter [Bacillus paralicheniformis]MCR2016415.1 urea transporter [Bacillus paralicheniformis]
MRKNKHHLLSEAVFSRLITASLKGISQVILIENVMTGFLTLIAITIFSYYLGIIALLSAIIGTLAGKLGAADEKIINEGLLGYNSVLTGMALASFLTGPYMWLVALIGSALAAIFTAAMMHFTKRTEVPILTFPFVILTWFILLASYKLNGVKLSSALIPQDLTHWELKTAGGVNLVDGVFHGIGQVFFLNNTVSGILIFLAVFWAGRKLGLYAVIGNAVAIIIAFLLGGERSLITLGLYGYNAILTILAVSAIFKSEHNRFSFLSGIISACLTVPITAGLSTYLLPYGLPALTMPFVLCSWLFLGARKVLQNL